MTDLVTDAEAASLRERIADLWDNDYFPEWVGKKVLRLLATREALIAALEGIMTCPDCRPKTLAKNGHAPIADALLAQLHGEEQG